MGLFLTHQISSPLESQYPLSRQLSRVEIVQGFKSHSIPMLYSRNYKYTGYHFQDKGHYFQSSDQKIYEMYATFYSNPIFMKL